MTDLEEAASTDHRDGGEVLIVTGMSGAGRSTVADALEDLGWYVVDNLPPSLIGSLVEMVGRAAHEPTRVAVAVDVRGRSFFSQLEQALADLRERGISHQVLFLDAADDTLVRRFESVRRPHPLQGEGRLLDGIQRERSMLDELRGGAQTVIDTTHLNVHQLSAMVAKAYGDVGGPALRVTVMSFGFKYGIPVDADIVCDVRFLPNPYWVPELRDLTGLDPAVSDYVTDPADARDFLDRQAAILDLVSDGYLREGKRYVTVAIGCTGGKHRSVAMAENLAARLVKVGVEVLVVHRDLGRE